MSAFIGFSEFHRNFHWGTFSLELLAPFFRGAHGEHRVLSF